MGTVIIYISPANCLLLGYWMFSGNYIDAKCCAYMLCFVGMVIEPGVKCPSMSEGSADWVKWIGDGFPEKVSLGR